MEKYGIKNITPEILNYNFDVYYRECAIKIKEIENKKDAEVYRENQRKKMSQFLNVQVDLEELKSNFINLLLDNDCAKLLWILYGNYDGNENYIDKLSNILMRENKVTRGGVNTYKMNGWMCHSLYVFQIANDNIPNNKEILNFNGRPEIKNQVQELNKLYKKLDKDLIFILRIFTLIHDIGVIEDILLHNETGIKYVDTVLEELGITDKSLKENEIGICLRDLTKILKVLIKYHTLITMLSTEGSDCYVEDNYRDLLNDLPNSYNIRKMNPILLFIFAYGDIIGVDEKLMDDKKFNRVRDGYLFFQAIAQNKIPERDKEIVAIERICDIVGKISYDELKNKIQNMLEANSVNYIQFINNMYNLRYMKYASTLMKILDDVELSIKVFAKIFDLINALDLPDSIKEYTVMFNPDKPEIELVRIIKSGEFFKCIEKMITQKIYDLTYNNLRINVDKSIKEIIVRVV